MSGDVGPIIFNNCCVCLFTNFMVQFRQEIVEDPHDAYRILVSNLLDLGVELFIYPIGNPTWGTGICILLRVII